MVVARSEIRAVRRVVKQLPVEMLLQCSSASSCMRARSGMEEHYTGRQHSTSFVLHWECVTGLTQTKGLILGPSARRTKDLLKLNRNQLRWVVGLFIEHCHLKEHLFKFGLTDDPICERCLEKDE
jgi:hypothetical protein